MKKRSNGEGSVVYDKERNSYRAFIVSPEGKRISKRFKVEADAIAWKTEQLNSINKGLFIAPNSTSVGKWAIEWLMTYKKRSVAQSTFEHYAYLTRQLKPIADIGLQDLTATGVQKFYIELEDKTNLSNHTIHKVHKLLKDMYTKAYQLGMIHKNIMMDVTAPKYEKKEVEIFTRTEIEKILCACHKHPVLKNRYPIILLATTTGLRLGELLGLRWRDVNLADEEIHVRRSLTCTKALGLTLGPLKTKSSTRKIRVTPEMITEFKALKSKAILDIKQEALCFVTRNGTPISAKDD